MPRNWSSGTRIQFCCAYAVNEATVTARTNVKLMILCNMLQFWTHSHHVRDVYYRMKSSGELTNGSFGSVDGVG